MKITSRTKDLINHVTFKLIFDHMVKERDEHECEFGSEYMEDDAWDFVYDTCGGNIYRVYFEPHKENVNDEDQTYTMWFEFEGRRNSARTGSMFPIHIDEVNTSYMNEGEGKMVCSIWLDFCVRLIFDNMVIEKFETNAVYKEKKIGFASDGNWGRVDGGVVEVYLEYKDEDGEYENGEIFEIFENKYVFFPGPSNTKRG